MSRRRAFGSVRKLRSGRFQVRYTGPDGRHYTGRQADGRALTFATRGAAGAYLAGVAADIERGRWVSPDAPRAAPPPLLADYAAAWMRQRRLADRTREHYAQLLRDHVLPVLGGLAVPAITPSAVRLWHAGLAGTTGPTAQAHAYGLLRSIMATAVADDLIPASPCRVRGAGQSRRAGRTELPALGELEVIVARTPAQYRAMVLIAAWCGLRFGELAELRRSDADLPGGRLHVRRAVVRTSAGTLVKTPKSQAGRRDVAVPPHLLPALAAHLREYVAAGPDSLLFPAKGGGHLAPSSLYRWWRPATAAAGRPDLRFHDLRHLGATMAAVAGATTAELMGRLGHSTASAAQRYQHVAADRDAVIAAALSDLATVTPITAARAARRPAR